MERFSEWEKLQPAYMPSNQMMAQFSDNNNLPSPILPSKSALNGFQGSSDLIHIEKELRLGQLTDSIKEIQAAIRHMAWFKDLSRSAGAHGSSKSVATRSQNRIRRFSAIIKGLRNLYNQAQVAFKTLGGNTGDYPVMSEHDASIEGMPANLRGKGTRQSSWIWRIKSEGAGPHEKEELWHLECE